MKKKRKPWRKFNSNKKIPPKAKRGRARSLSDDADERRNKREIRKWLEFKIKIRLAREGEKENGSLAKDSREY